MSKEINLTKGQVAVVDDDDYDWLTQWNWQANKNKSTKSFYAVRRDSIRMHRIITQCPSGMEVDHINHNTLDNRRSNLRVCSKTQNQRNAGIRKDNKTGFKGVDATRGKFRARIKVDKREVHIGYYKTAEAAAKAYDNFAERYFGDFAYHLSVPRWEVRMSTEPDENAGITEDELWGEDECLSDEAWAIRETLEERENERLHPATSRA